MIRIALINPPQPYLVEKQTQVPLGLLYLSAVIKREKPNVKVQVIDFSTFTIKEAALAIEEFDIYGFTATSLDYPISRELMEELRERFPYKCYIIGGSHISALPQDAERDGFDSAFVGESEKTVLQFLDDFSNGKIKKIYQATELIDMDWLPFPDRDALSWKGGRILIERHKKSANIMASRGCPFNCYFCASCGVWGRRSRYRSVESVVEEIKYCMKKYDIKVFRFSDDSIHANPGWIDAFCEKVADLGITWRISERANLLLDRPLDLLKRAGCLEINIGVESFDSNVLRALNKKITVDNSLSVIPQIWDAGIKPRLLLMISTPGETYSFTVDQNIKALQEIGNRFSLISTKIMMPFPGSRFWKQPEMHNIKIISRNMKRYNYYLYHSGGRDEQPWSPIVIDAMTREEQLNNIKRMVEFLESLPQNHRG